MKELLEKYVSCIMRNIEFMNLSVMLQIGVNCLLEVKQGIVIRQNLEEHFAHVLLYRVALFFCPVYPVGSLSP